MCSQSPVNSGQGVASELHVLSSKLDYTPTKMVPSGLEPLSPAAYGLPSYLLTFPVFFCLGLLNYRTRVQGGDSNPTKAILR
jgi:hypothetical protein